VEAASQIRILRLGIDGASLRQSRLFGRRERQPNLDHASKGARPYGSACRRYRVNVFEWFRQADAKSRSQSGLGLGLGIVRHLVQLHGGSVRAESRGERQGATFTVTLPVHVPAVATVSAAQPAEVPSLPVPRRLDAVKVLVVEDDDDTRELVRVTLENAGASVEVVATAEEARREMLADAPDVLISDIRMPEEDGYSLIRSLRGVGVATPAIALTAFARSEDADEARAAGFQIHLSKPVDAGRLVEAVATLVEDPIVH
jgi:CheY-like chemotaxis protein